ncbi:MAG: hypothetical protein K9K78_07020 [Spirochaetales bacterium]|nr:hypothetical protein [Spirochaetales bacterium]
MSHDESFSGLFGASSGYLRGIFGGFLGDFWGSSGDLRGIFGGFLGNFGVTSGIYGILLVVFGSFYIFRGIDL